MKTYDHYIGGATSAPSAGAYFDTHNPYTGEIWAMVARGGPEDADRAVQAVKAGTVWVNTYRTVSFMSPFGGYKRSRQGRESRQQAIKDFMRVKSAWIADETSTANPFIMR